MTEFCFVSKQGQIDKSLKQKLPVAKREVAITPRVAV